MFTCQTILLVGSPSSSRATHLNIYQSNYPSRHLTTVPRGLSTNLVCRCIVTCSIMYLCCNIDTESDILLLRCQMCQQILSQQWSSIKWEWNLINGRDSIVITSYQDPSPSYLLCNTHTTPYTSSRHGSIQLMILDES